MTTLPPGPYRCILADPPWKYANWSDKAHGAAVSHYKTMPTSDIMALPVERIAADDALLFLWTTWPKIAEGAHIEVALSWGFRPITCAFLWRKTYADGRPYCGLGFYTRSGSEACMLAVRGKPRVLAHDVYSVIEAPVSRHSAKPEDQYRRIEALCHGPRVELFARCRREGWDAWGDQVP